MTITVPGKQADELRKGHVMKEGALISPQIWDIFPITVFYTHLQELLSRDKKGDSEGMCSIPVNIYIYKVCVRVCVRLCDFQRYR